MHAKPLTFLLDTNSHKTTVYVPFVADDEANKWPVTKDGMAHCILVTVLMTSA